MVYNIISGNYQKFGFATKFDNRKKSYITDNPNVHFIEGLRTYQKTKHKLESAIHRELKEKGYEFLVNHNTQTEWFEIKNGMPLRFCDLECCKGRKVYALDD